jgi:tetratricopeptide (TPR) repeat protein
VLRTGLARDLMSFPSASRRLGLVLLASVVSLATPAGAGAGATAASLEPDPDALYRQRETLDLAMRAAEIWQARLAASPNDFELACKLARAHFWIGESLPRSERAPHYRSGMAAARTAIALDPRRPDGHFWLGVNMGALAGASNPFTALRSLSAIREALETSVARDPAFSRGGGLCALGKYYNAVPPLLGGDKAQSEALLRRCVSYDPASIVGHYYLGQTLAARGKTDEARLALRKALDAPFDPDYVPEGKVWKRRARRLLDKLDGVTE